MSYLVSQARSLFSLRSTWVYLIITLLAVAALPVLVVLTTREEDDGPLSLSGFFGGSDLICLVAIFAGAMLIGAEISRGSIGWMYLSTNHRLGIALARVTLLVLGFFAAITLGAAVAMLVVVALGHDVNFSPEGSDFLFILASYVEVAVFLVLAAMLTYVLGKAVYAAMILLIDMMILELAVTAYAEGGASWAQALAHLLPRRNTAIMMLGEDSGYTVTGSDRPVATLVLVGMVFAVTAAAGWVINRRAVN
ncbi:hypothetical protein [Corynebacterium oculi]|uniref:ABC-2 family transporter protein n=1 Tax=Corynebacterium oculi TaxID=1544416 RepID=A0A0Q0YSJ7_9CORY|nr:hypothetical protein [Corynebacterium oculi]KQB85357.1 ABC-2 family transporter protein [Corynebacterium oculi]